MLRQSIDNNVTKNEANTATADIMVQPRLFNGSLEFDNQTVSFNNMKLESNSGSK